MVVSRYSSVPAGGEEFVFPAIFVNGQHLKQTRPFLAQGVCFYLTSHDLVKTSEVFQAIVKTDMFWNELLVDIVCEGVDTGSPLPLIRKLDNTGDWSSLIFAFATVPVSLFIQVRISF
jgi:hypothetical protein